MKRRGIEKGLEMVKVLEGKHRSSRKCGRGGRGGLPGLARLRHECHRFREEVACIRTFPRLQLRWPPLARLEIGNESSEEDASSVWDVAESERPYTLFISGETEGVAEACPGNVMEFPSPKLAPVHIASKADGSTSGETKGVGEACPGNVVEFPSPKLAPLHIDSKAGGSTSGEKFGGFKENEKSLQDEQGSQEMDDLEEITLGCEDLAGTEMGCNARNEEDAMESQEPADGTLESKMAQPMLEPLTAVKETSDPSDDGSLMDALKGQTLNTIHSHSGARIAATALFTANPHFDPYERSIGCSPSCNFTCQSEGLKLVAFPGSNVSHNASCKEREPWSEQVLCPSFESHICSPSELNGYATVDKRNQTSTPIGTNSLAHPDRRLLTSVHLVAPNCTSDIDHEWDDGQVKIGLRGPEILMAPVHVCPFLTGQDQNVLDHVKQSGLALRTSNYVEDYGIPTSSVGDPPRTAVDNVQSAKTHNQNGFAEQGNQKHDICLTDDSAGGRRVSMTFMSGLEETSTFPTSSSLQNHSYSLFPTKTGPPSASRKQGSGCLGLISLSGMKNFARLGVGSTRDSVMTAQMAQRIKHALERLGDIGNQGHRHRKSVSIKKGKWTDEIYTKWKNNSEATFESTVQSDSKRSRNPHELCENIENKRSESHFFSSREYGEQTLGHEQSSKQTHEAKSVTHEEPDLYLQEVIAALDSTYRSDVKEATLKTSTSATGLQVDQHCPPQGRDGDMSTKLSLAHANGTSLTTPGEVFKRLANKDCVADQRSLHTTNVAMSGTVLEEKYSEDYVNSIRELISRPYHTHEQHDTVGQDCRVSSKFSKARATGSPSPTPGEVFECHSDKDCVADPRILNSTNVVGTDTLLQDEHPANDVCSMGGLGGLIPHRYHTDEEPAAEVCSEDLPAFTVQINAPPGSFFQVEVGGHPTVHGELEEANEQVLGNPVVYSPSPSGRQGKCNVRVGHRKSRLLQQRALQASPLTHHERPVGPTNYGIDPLPASKKVQDGRRTKHASLSPLELSPPVANQVDSPKFSPTMRSSTQEDLRHSFDRKITTLVKKANQLQEEAKLPGTSTHTRQGSRCCQRQLLVTGPKRQPDSIPSRKASHSFRYGDSCHEGQGPIECTAKRRDPENKDAARSTQSKVRRVQRPSILKSSVNTKSLDLDSSSCPSHRESQAAQTAKKMQAFGAAAAGLAHELNVLMKDRRSGHKVKSQAPNKRKVAWASPEAYELGPRSSIKAWTSQSGMHLGTYNHKLSTRQRITHSKFAWHDDASLPTAHALHDVPKTKEQRHGPFERQRKASRHPQPPKKLSVDKSCEVYDAVSASTFSELGKMKVPQETGVRSQQPLSVQERGEAGVTKVLDSSAGEIFDYDQFRQELKDLQLERTKLENLVHTIFSTDADPEGSTADNLAKHVPKNANFIVKGAKRDPVLEDHDKRRGSGISPNRDSGKNGSHHAGKVGIRQREFGSDLSWVTLSDDTVGSKVSRKSHPQLDKKTNDRAGSTVEQEKSLAAAIPSGEEFKSARDDAKDVLDTSQQYRKLLVAGSDTQLQEKDENIGFHGKPESDIQLLANLGFSSTDVLHERFPNLSSILAGEDATSATRSAYAASKLQVSKPDYFKEYLLQALDSSILLLQHCVNQSEELQDPARPNSPEPSNMHPSTELVSRITERTLDNNSNELYCTEGFSERRTQVDVADDAIVEVLARQNEHDHLQEHMNKLDTNVLSLQQDECQLKDGDASYRQKPEPTIDSERIVVPLQQILEDGKPQVENTTLETQKMAFDRSQESDSKGSSLEKDSNWSGSLKSVMEAYEEAQRSAALLISASPQVHKATGRPSSSCRSEHSDKLPGVEKPKLRMEGMLKRKVKESALTLLEKAEKAEAKALKLRHAEKKYVKSKQNSLRSTGYRGGKEKLQARLRKHYSGREQWQVPKLIYRTAEFSTKGRDDWNDSTEISYDKHGTGWNPNAKEAAQALIAKVLNDELLRKQRRLGIKHLKALEADVKRKRKDPVNLETYANTIAQIRGREKPPLSMGNPLIQDKREAGESQGIRDDVPTKQSTPQCSMERNATGWVNYFASRNLLETENHVLDESTMVFKRAREHAGQLNSGSGGNLRNPDVRESIEHWLDTSGGFEFLDSYNEAGEEDIFERQESTNSMQRNITFSTVTVESKNNLSDEIFHENLSFPSSEMDGRRFSTSRTTGLDKLRKGPSGDLSSTSNSANRNAMHCSLGKHEELPQRIGSGHEDDHPGGLSAHSSLKPDKSSLGGSFGISNGSGSDQIVGEFPSQEPAHMESVNRGGSFLCRKGKSRLDGSTCPSQGDAHATPPKFHVNEAHSGPMVQATDFEEKLTEEEELELALLEIVLQTILKDDLPSETVATMTCGVPSAPGKRRSSGSSATPTTACASTPCSVVPALTGRVTPMSIDDKGLRDGVYLDQGVQTSTLHPPSLDFPAEEHGIDSAKSSGEDWPEYKCLAEMQSGSQSVEEDEHWPEYHGVNEVDDGVDQGTPIEELPLDQISTPSTNEVETDEKLPRGGTLSPRAVPVSSRPSTRPPYSAVHSIRASERQSIDFPGIASLAFGYPSPRPAPPSNPIGQTSVDRSSVSVQTAHMSMTQSAPLSTSICVVPLYYLPPYSMYLPPSPPSGLPSQASTVPMTIPGQHGSQFIASHYASGVIPLVPSPYMFPPSAPFSQSVSQTDVMSVAPIVQNNQQTQTTVNNSPFPPSSSYRPATDGPSQPSTAVKFAPTSSKNTSSHLGKIFVDVTEHSSSPSGSRRSSLETPSTILSSPEHESRVASALARPPRIGRGIAGQAFEEVSSDDAVGIDEVSRCKEDEDPQLTTLPCSTKVKKEEDPLLESIIAEDSYKQSRIENTPPLDFLPIRMASSTDKFILNQQIGRSDQPEPGTSESVDSARSSVLVASYDGSGSSEGSVKHTRGKASAKSSGQSSRDGFCRFKHGSLKPTGQVGFSQTSSRSSGEILGACGISLRGLGGNQRILSRHFSSGSLPLSEGEVEPGQMPSEGEYFGPCPNAWVPHPSPRLLVNRLTRGRDIISEPGEICQQAFMQLRPPRSEIGGHSGIGESLSEGELRVEILTEPGEVRATSELPESLGATASGDPAK